MGFFKLYKPREYKYRYIYYDPKKEAREERERQLAEEEERKGSGEFRTSIKRGTFRQMADKNKTGMKDQVRKSNIRLLIIVAILLALVFYLLS